MCRWLAYSGTPLLLETILYKPAHSLIDQSLHSRMGVETTNGDGFGIGWYPEHAEIDTPAVVRDIGPAWNNRNLREIAEHVKSPLFFAHVRATTGTAVQQSNCHPFRHGRWMWMHNGSIAGFQAMRRELCMAVDPALFLDIEGTTDSEVMFFLALTFGLDDDPPGAVARMVGLVERTGHTHGIATPMQMTVAVTDGSAVWAFRYASDGAARSLYYSSQVDSLRALHPDVSFLRGLSEETRLVVSEPLGDLPGAWNEVPQHSYGVVRPGADALHPFAPLPA
ncbi:MULTISPECIES: class II glutamine amidotransferase [unclassified Streptomyces]|uniref:class II glutamine amidotransferase n=1 Tax=unclassified Streptomyces TaxID=2593676 RepID=UPI001BE8E370|nr:MULTISPECIES: class II glutamine amidotransferase [unclassified Streptomyces]MBT2408643.1 class II glutamine amidotransferase [Streptomyces sp. ISL-21]MBT2608673.1 class II glutamine amidotransferase [Streptomyces sp. ISL-87]